MFVWNPVTGDVLDYFTGEPHKRTFSFLGSTAVTGFSSDIAGEKEVVFDYSRGTVDRTGTIRVSDMPEEIASQSMSLWNFALELHAGRCYSPFLGPISNLFVFIAGLLLTLILVSGYIIHKKRRR